MRRLLLIVAIIIVLAGIGVFVYLRFFTATPNIVVAPNGSGLPVAQTNALPTDMGTSSSSTPEIVGSSVAKTVSARLVQISTGPVALGEAVTDIPIATTTSATTASSTALVSYIERESGNVFTYNAVTGTITRTSNQTVPGIQSAQWLPDASFAFIRYLSGTDNATINTYALPAVSNATQKGFFLPQDLAGIAVSSTGVLTLASGANGSSVSVEKADGTHNTDLFSTPLSSVSVSFAGKSAYLVTTKPTAGLDGYAYIVKSGVFSRVAGPLTGLTALASPSGKQVLISYTVGGTLHMELVSVATGEVTTLPVATIADKCVWAADSSALYCGIPQNPPSGSYPDDWYQGLTSFSDRIWKLDVTGQYAQLVLDFNAETGTTLDAEALAVDPNGTMLTFVNKNDSSLWGFSL